MHCYLQISNFSSIFLFLNYFKYLPMYKRQYVLSVQIKIYLQLIDYNSIPNTVLLPTYLLFLFF